MCFVLNLKMLWACATFSCFIHRKGEAVFIQFAKFKQGGAHFLSHASQTFSRTITLHCMLQQQIKRSLFNSSQISHLIWLFIFILFCLTSVVFLYFSSPLLFLSAHSFHSSLPQEELKKRKTEWLALATKKIATHWVIRHAQINCLLQEGLDERHGGTLGSVWRGETTSYEEKWLILESSIRKQLKYKKRSKQYFCLFASK